MQFRSVLEGNWFSEDGSLVFKDLQNRLPEIVPHVTCNQCSEKFAEVDNRVSIIQMMFVLENFRNNIQKIDFHPRQNPSHRARIASLHYAATKVLLCISPTNKTQHDKLRQMDSHHISPRVPLPHYWREPYIFTSIVPEIEWQSSEFSISSGGAASRKFRLNHPARPRLDTIGFTVLQLV